MYELMETKGMWVRMFVYNVYVTVELCSPFYTAIHIVSLHRSAIPYDRKYKNDSLRLIYLSFWLITEVYKESFNFKSTNKMSQSVTGKKQTNINIIFFFVHRHIFAGAGGLEPGAA
jgi:hypothetical protein